MLASDQIKIQIYSNSDDDGGTIMENKYIIDSEYVNYIGDL